MSRVFRILLITILLIMGHSGYSQKQDQHNVIYSSDLLSPPDDPDDHFDLLTFLSLDEIYIKAIILDAPIAHKGIHVGKSSNYKAIERALKIFNRNKVPTASGLKKSLPTRQSSGADYPKGEQSAIELIIRQLNSSADKSVTIITTGSLRDIAAAYNRKPDLFKNKIDRLIISVGDSYGLIGTEDHNTSLDVEAWKILMTSDLPIDWMPTNPSKGRGGPSRYCSYWYFTQPEIVSHIPEEIVQFFKEDGIDITEKKQRHMWSTPAFIELAGLKCYEVEGKIRWIQKTDGEEPGKELIPYELLPIEFSLDNQGKAVWKTIGGKDTTNKRIFRINDYFLYNETMFEFLKAQLGKSK